MKKVIQPKLQFVKEFPPHVRRAMAQHHLIASPDDVRCKGKPTHKPNGCCLQNRDHIKQIEWCEIYVLSTLPWSQRQKVYRHELGHYFLWLFFARKYQHVIQHWWELIWNWRKPSRRRWYRKVYKEQCKARQQQKEKSNG